MPSRVSPAVLLAGLLLLACTPSPGLQSGTEAGRRDTDLITGDEIRETGHSNALEVVRSLRGAWLRERPPSSFGPPEVIVIYVDNVKWGDVSTLGQIPTSGVEAIRRLNPVDATQRWGPGHGAGVIWIQTTRP